MVRPAATKTCDKVSFWTLCSYFHTRPPVQFQPVKKILILTNYVVETVVSALLYSRVRHKKNAVYLDPTLVLPEVSLQPSRTSTVSSAKHKFFQVSSFLNNPLITPIVAALLLT